MTCKHNNGTWTRVKSAYTRGRVFCSDGFDFNRTCMYVFLNRIFRETHRMDALNDVWNSRAISKTTYLYIYHTIIGIYLCA